MLVTGAGGQLGQYLVPAALAAGADVVTLVRRADRGADVVADLADPEATMLAVRDAAPDVVIHAAACTDVDAIERDPQRGETDNVMATRNVAAAVRAVGAYLVAVSTDMVFAGDGGAPYAEDAPTAPISAYGRSKLQAEQAVLEWERRTGELLDATPPFSSIVAANNFMAIGALRALRARGLQVPRDMALVCFDDLEQAAQIDPFLTVMAQPAYTMGTLAMQLLGERIDRTYQGPSRLLTLSPRLLVRRSCGAQETAATDSAAIGERDTTPVATGAMLAAVRST